MQPNSYYGFGMTPAQQSQSQPVAAANAAAKATKKHNGLVPVVIILLLICIGLGVYIAIDKMSQPSGPDTIVQADPTSITESIANIKLPENGDAHDQELAKALVGRVFIADVSNEQSITFNSNTDFTYGYYKDPSIDFRKVQPSTSHGKFEVKGNNITLSSGDTFRLENDYLIKTADDFSKNANTIYFDIHQAKTTFSSINTALDTYIKSQIKATKNAIAADRIAIDFGTMRCKVGDNHLTNADNYYCSVGYDIYVTKDTAEKIVSDSQKAAEPKEGEENTDTKPVVYKNFMDYCDKNTNAAEFSKGGTCYEDYHIRANANIIVRINSDGYRITGLFR